MKTTFDNYEEFCDESNHTMIGLLDHLPLFKMVALDSIIYANRNLHHYAKLPPPKIVEWSMMNDRVIEGNLVLNQSIAHYAKLLMIEDFYMLGWRRNAHYLKTIHTNEEESADYYY